MSAQQGGPAPGRGWEASIDQLEELYAQGVRDGWGLSIIVAAAVAAGSVGMTLVAVAWLG